MRPFLLLLLCLVFCASVYGYTKIEKLSHQQALDALGFADHIDKETNAALKTEFMTKFRMITGNDYDFSLRDQLYTVLKKNADHTSFFMKMMGLVTFQNTLIVCMVLVAVAFVLSCARDLVMFLGAYLAYAIVQLILNKKCMYSIGIGVSLITMYFKPDEITNPWLRYLFIFDWITPLFGCILFGIMSFTIYADLHSGHPSEKYLRVDDYHAPRHGGYGKNNNFVGIGFFVTIAWSIVTIYHQNWLTGIAAVMMLFFTCGFLFGAMFGGYQAGFTDDESVLRCLIVSIILNAFMVGVNCGFITGNITQYTKVFETGVYFWGTFVGSLAMLICSDEHYMSFKKRDDFGSFMMMQILSAVYYLGLMYLGNILNITSYKTIGGTFLVLWGLDLEWTVLRKMGTGHVTVALGIVLVNLYILKQLIGWYPEYCIF